MHIVAMVMIKFSPSHFSPCLNGYLILITIIAFCFGMHQICILCIITSYPFHTIEPLSAQDVNQQLHCEITVRRQFVWKENKASIYLLCTWQFWNVLPTMPLCQYTYGMLLYITLYSYGIICSKQTIWSKCSAG